MAKDQTKRLKPAKIIENNTAYSALKSITRYEPSNADYSMANGDSLMSAMQRMQEAEAQAEAAYKAARDNANEAEWAFHNFILGAKNQVKAQFGVDSNELQSLGLKKKTEYKKPAARKKV